MTVMLRNSKPRLVSIRCVQALSEPFLGGVWVPPGDCSPTCWGEPFGSGPSMQPEAQLPASLLLAQVPSLLASSLLFLWSLISSPKALNVLNRAACPFFRGQTPLLPSHTTSSVQAGSSFPSLRAENSPEGLRPAPTRGRMSPLLVESINSWSGCVNQQK